MAGTGTGRGIKKMSEALDYLIKVRKDAIEPYFQFLKEGGKHLDDKTRSLLSVITKVDAKTEGGLKQYLKRALKQGNSADEILDAMLTCMPTLGLSKIIWAIDIIIKMDLPEFDPDNLVKGKQSKKKQWNKLIAVNEVDEGVSRIELDDQAFFITKNENGFQIFNSHCPHQSEDIPCSAINGMEVTCPKHQWKFNMANGECIDVGDKPLNTIEHKVDGGSLYVYF